MNRFEEVYSNMDVIDMLKNPIHPQHEKLVINAEKKFKINYLVPAFVSLLISIVLAYTTIGIILNNELNDILVGCILFGMFSLIFFIIFITGIKKVFQIRNGMDKCQYAVVKDKYYTRNIGTENNRKHFYVNVVFEDNLKSLGKVHCSPND